MASFWQQRHESAQRGCIGSFVLQSGNPWLLMVYAKTDTTLSAALNPTHDSLLTAHF